MKKTSVLAVAAFLAAPAALFAAPGLVTVDVAPTLAAVARSSQDDAIYRAFDDVLDREPSSRELRRYRELMEDDDWSERDIRSDLRRRQTDSRERAAVRDEDPDATVRRAYQDILNREPDAEGLRNYRRRIVEDQWSERDVRDALRRSREYRQKNTVTQQQAEDIVKRAYRTVLGREPDAASRGYVDQVMREHWSQEDVEEDLRKSPEFRTKVR